MKTESEVRDYLVAIQSRLPKGAVVVLFPDTPRQWCRIASGAHLESLRAAFESVELSHIGANVWAFPLDTCVPAELPECNRHALQLGLAGYADYLKHTGPVRNMGHVILKNLWREFGRENVTEAIKHCKLFDESCRRPFTIQ